jgi:hypothetical protein
MEPLRGFLGRYLRHRLLAIETKTKVQDVQVCKGLFTRTVIFVPLCLA